MGKSVEDMTEEEKREEIAYIHQGLDELKGEVIAAQYIDAVHEANKKLIKLGGQPITIK